MNDDKKILIVDDDPAILFVACKKVRAAGWEPIAAVDGIDAVRKILEHPGCRRMITDFVMPSFGGDAWIRFLERFCNDWTIVVASTADVDPGHFVVMPKPLDFENVLHVFAREVR
jgi:CheY-like chemotaxis protein